MWSPRNRSILGRPSSLSITLFVPLLYAKGNSSLEEKEKTKRNEINKPTKQFLIRASELYFFFNAYRY